MVAIKIRMQYLRGVSQSYYLEDSIFANLRNKQLAIIRSGKGAAIMAPGVKRIALEFPFKNQNGAMGPRYILFPGMPSYPPLKDNI